MNPVAQRLPVHAARRRRLSPRGAIQDHGQRQHTPCRVGVFALRGCLSKARRVVLRPSDRNRHAALLRIDARKIESQPQPSGNHGVNVRCRWYYVRFDLNDYSVPHTHVRRTLTVLADTHELRIVDGAQVVALHRRSYDRGAQIEQTEHLQALIQQKRAARQHRATDRLAQVAPASQELLVRAAERGANLGTIINGLTRLLDRYGAADLQAGIRDALERDVPHPNAVRLALERRRELRGEGPPVDVDLPADVRARDAPVQPHALETYDRLKDVDDE
jgi:hypothetical protein